MRSQQIAQLLPDVFQSALGDPSVGGVGPDRPMAALLSAMEDLHAPVETVLDQLADHLNPLTAPASMVPYLAMWVDLDRMVRPSSLARGPLEGEPDRLRLLVSAASVLSRWRGTARGLVRFLEAATGVPGFVVEENVTGESRSPRDFHLRLLAPAQAEAHSALIDEILSSETPAYVTYEVAFAGEAAEPPGSPKKPKKRRPPP